MSSLNLYKNAARSAPNLSPITKRTTAFGTIDLVKLVFPVLALVKLAFSLPYWLVFSLAKLAYLAYPLHTPVQKILHEAYNSMVSFIYPFD